MNVIGNGVHAAHAPDPDRGDRPAGRPRPAAHRGRGTDPLRLAVAALRAHRDRGGRWPASARSPAQDRRPAGCRRPRPAGLHRPRTGSTSAASPTRTSVSGRASTSASGSAGPDRGRGRAVGARAEAAGRSLAAEPAQARVRHPGSAGARGRGRATGGRCPDRGEAPFPAGSPAPPCHRRHSEEGPATEPRPEGGSTSVVAVERGGPCSSCARRTASSPCACCGRASSSAPGGACTSSRR